MLTCLALAALERAENQVTLGWLVGRILAFARDGDLAAAGITFTLQSREERADVAAVARLLLEIGALVRVAGDERSFVNDTGDALYDVDRAVLSALLIARRGPSTVTDPSLPGRLAVSPGRRSPTPKTAATAPSATASPAACSTTLCSATPTSPRKNAPTSSRSPARKASH